MDKKGRVSIPADIRRVIEAGDPNWVEGRTAVMYMLHSDHLDRQLHGYTVNGFSAIARQIDALDLGSEERRVMSVLFLNQSIKVEVDKDGRVIFAARLRDKLNVEEGALNFAGLGDHFEVWPAERFETSVSDEVANWLSKQPENFNPLSMLRGR